MLAVKFSVGARHLFSAGATSDSKRHDSGVCEPGGERKPAGREIDGEAVCLVPPRDVGRGSNPDLPRREDHPRHVSRVYGGMEFNPRRF